MKQGVTHMVIAATAGTGAGAVGDPLVGPRLGSNYNNAHRGHTRVLEALSNTAAQYVFGQRISFLNMFLNCSDCSAINVTNGVS